MERSARRQECTAEPVPELVLATGERGAVALLRQFGADLAHQATTETMAVQMTGFFDWHSTVH